MLWFSVPIAWLIPGFIAILLVMALPFFRGRDYAFLLKLILGLSAAAVPLAIAALLARNIFEFFAIWFMVLLAPLLWLLGSLPDREGARFAGEEAGLMAQILPWLPLVALSVLVLLVIVLRLLHHRASRRQPRT